LAEVVVFVVAADFVDSAVVELTVAVAAESPTPTETVSVLVALPAILSKNQFDVEDVRLQDLEYDCECDVSVFVVDCAHDNIQDGVGDDASSLCVGGYRSFIFLSSASQLEERTSQDNR